MDISLKPGFYQKNEQAENYKTDVDCEIRSWVWFEAGDYDG